MRIGRDKLRQILLEEACGCMASEPEMEYAYGVEDDDHYPSPHSSVDKNSVLNCVAVLAMSVDCPVTRDTLLSTVYELMS